ncbi:hypothetical protein B0G71_8145 [Paraburkholderia sp. BL27I4N3]|uniref:hypothetical protein n=1 Tax=Paraburkholderia sp. BL27I4N3 TaxID=1938805 RepID=UPI000E2298CC|nr:hypothetical protein [Paraburkholderia sp. BL27I4N3]REE07088.1 hypothetical protein B0G71_7561 [Paraburkholderia sp. BL27I4N3]REE07606.1 hypothetical protein B0G71_8145 [Paraburkholderia sp. BL27I4N3]
MADIYLLTGLTLPAGIAHESLPGAVKAFIADCWQGMSRTQMIARAKSRKLRLSFCATRPCAHGETGVFALRFSDGTSGCLMLAHLRRVRNSRGRNRRPGRTAVSRPPARDPRQTTLF